LAVNLLDVVYLGVAGVTSPWWLRKARGGWGQRFAIDPPTLGPKTPGRPRVMLHAVSVGEAAALRKLVPMLVEAGAEVVVSCTTDTGLARSQALYAGCAHVVRYPLDASWSVRRFLDAIDPDVVGLVELELWPNFMSQCARRGIPVAVVNGRLSEKSFKGYRKIARWMRPSFASLTLAAVQDEDYAQRFVAMGTPEDRVVVSGSMKFDAASIADRVDGQDELAAAMGINLDRPLVVAGSTGPGEEAMLHAVCEQVGSGSGGGVQLLCAPRRPERFEDAAEAMPGCVRRSNGQGDRTSGRFLLDTIGELAAAYALADVVVVGRSFPTKAEGSGKGRGAGGLGGSDPIEPIALGKPTIFGPDSSNFKDAVSGFVRVLGMVQVRDSVELGERIRLLLEDPGAAEAMVQRGRDWIREQQGASDRHCQMLLELAAGDGKLLVEAPLEG